MNFYLVGGVSYILAVVFRFLVFDKVYSYSVYFSEFIDSFKVMVDGLIEEGCKFLVVEDFKVVIYYWEKKIHWFFCFLKSIVFFFFILLGKII